MTSSEKGRHALTDVLTTPEGMEYSVHRCPKQYLEDLKAIFPKQDPSNILIVTTCQNANLDLVNVGETVEDEKDRLLEVFVEWAKGVCEKIITSGYFADYLDPASGLPMINKDTTTVYSEVDALTTLLGYKSTTAGCCRVVFHPKWGTAVYPATMFTNAPLEKLLESIAKQNT